MYRLFDCEPGFLGSYTRFGALAEWFIVGNLKSPGVCEHPHQFESDTPRPHSQSTIQHNNSVKHGNDVTILQEGGINNGC